MLGRRSLRRQTQTLLERASTLTGYGLIVACSIPKGSANGARSNVITNGPRDRRERQLVPLEAMEARHGKGPEVRVLVGNHPARLEAGHPSADGRR